MPAAAMFCVARLCFYARATPVRPFSLKTATPRLPFERMIAALREAQRAQAVPMQQDDVQVRPQRAQTCEKMASCLLLSAVAARAKKREKMHRKHAAR